MKGKNYTDGRIIGKLRQGEGLFASGMSLDQVAKQLSIGLSTRHRWNPGSSPHGPSPIGFAKPVSCRASARSVMLSITP